MRFALATLDLLATKGPAVNGEGESPSGKRNGDGVVIRTATKPADGSRGISWSSETQTGFRHAVATYAAPFFFSFGALNGIPNSCNSARPSSLLWAEVTNDMFMPWGRTNLSGFNSGNTNCSVKPRV